MKSYHLKAGQYLALAAFAAMFLPELAHAFPQFKYIATLGVVAGSLYRALLYAFGDPSRNPNGPPTASNQPSTPSDP